jgi:hypothetical protein
MFSVYRSTKAWVADTFEPLHPIYDAWMKLIAGFSWILVRVGVVFLFFTIFTLYGVGLRITGKDPMKRRLDPSHDSHWEQNIVNNDNLDDFKKQY